MKRIFLLILAAVLILCGCAGQEPVLQVSPAELTAEEESIANLLGADTNQKLFDFTVDDSAQTIQVNTYRLVNGKWAIESGGGGWRMPASQGRIVLGFDRIPEELRVGIQCGEDQSITTFGTKEVEFEAVGCATSFLSEPVPVTYGEEIPLVVQILTSKNQVVSYGVDYFFQPEEFAKWNHEAVYAITVCFLKEPLSKINPN